MSTINKNTACNSYLSNLPFTESWGEVAIPGNKFIFIWIIFIIFLMSYSDTFAQQHAHKIDSLLTALKTAKDTNKVRVLNALCWEYRNNDPEKALHYGMQGLDLAKHLAYKKGIAISYSCLGVINSLQGNYTKALEYYHKALKIHVEVRYKKGIAATIGNIGDDYKNQGNYVKALSYQLQALKIYKELRNSPDKYLAKKAIEGMGNIYNSIAAIYYHLGDYTKTIDYLLKSITIKEEIGDKLRLATSLNNIGAVYAAQGNDKMAIDYYQQALEISKELGAKSGLSLCLSNIGGVLHRQGNFKEALTYYLQALDIDEERGNKKGIATELNNIGKLYTDLDSLVQGWEYLQKALQIKKEIGDKRGVIYSLIGIGNNYIKQGNYVDAILSYEKAIRLAEEIEAKKELGAAYHDISEAYSKQNNFKKAYEYHLLYSEIKDSLINQEKSEAIGKLQGRYEAEKEQRERELKEKAEKEAADKVQAHLNVIYYSSIVAFLGLLFFVILFSGRFAIPVNIAKSVVFVGVIFLFEFILVLIEPMVEYYTGGNPALKVVINSSLALLILPVHNFLVNKLVHRVTKMKVARRKIKRKSKLQNKS